MKQSKSKNLDLVIEKIKKQTKDPNAIMKLGDRKKINKNIEVISTGSLALDTALGVGGVPKGRIVEIYGPESSGKSTLALHAVAAVQKAGGTCAYIDTEHALNSTYAQAIGIDIDNMFLSQPDYGEQALEIAETLVRSNAIDMIIIDSVAALVPRAEIEGEMGDHHVGLQARLMSQALRKITGNIQRSGATVVFINQIRMKIGVMFGSPETTTGGNALKFYSSVRLDIRRIGSVKEGDEVTGNETRVKVVKNKVSPPFKQAEFQIMYGLGINQEGEILDFGNKLGLVEKSGAFYKLDGESIGQGKSKASQFLKENAKVKNKLVKEIRSSYITSKSK